MFLQIHGHAGIENPQNHSPEIVWELEQALALGGTAWPDPKRNGFYDFETEDRTYFIHISPVSSRIVLVATWLRTAAEIACCV